MPEEVTQLLQKIESGDPKAAGDLLPLVYRELRRLAAARMAKERPGQTLQPTALVHEAWIRLVGNDQNQWENRRHFFAAVAEAMRRILVEKARNKQSVRHGAGLQRVDISEVEIPAGTTDQEDRLVAIDEALSKLEHQDPQKAQVVKLRYFVGMTNQEAAEAMGLSLATIERYWSFSKAWLLKEMRRSK